MTDWPHLASLDDDDALRVFGHVWCARPTTPPERRPAVPEPAFACLEDLGGASTFALFQVAPRGEDPLACLRLRRWRCRSREPAFAAREAQSRPIADTASSQEYAASPLCQSCPLARSVSAALVTNRRPALCVARSNWRLRADLRQVYRFAAMTKVKAFPRHPTRHCSLPNAPLPKPRDAEFPRTAAEEGQMVEFGTGLDKPACE